MTVTATIGGNSGDYGMLSVLVFTGANTAAPIGASGGGRGATGVISDTYTSTAAGSGLAHHRGLGAEGRAEGAVRRDGAGLLQRVR